MVVWVAINIVLLIAAYLLGSIPTGYWAGLILKGIDIRQHGSCSTGATNVLRTLGKGPAIVVLLIDVLKGALAIILTRFSYSLPSVTATAPSSVDVADWLPWVITLAGLAALLGHSKSIWIGFTGGKSVAAGLGVLFAMAWPVASGSLLVFGVVLALFRIVSLSSIAAAIAACVLMVVTGRPLPYQLLAIAGGLYVIWRHQANIQRLLAGTEPKLGHKQQET